MPFFRRTCPAEPPREQQILLNLVELLAYGYTIHMGGSHDREANRRAPGCSAVQSGI
jgi:hypothetical protein